MRIQIDSLALPFASNFPSSPPLLSFDPPLLSHIIKIGVAFCFVLFGPFRSDFRLAPALALAGVCGDQWSGHTLHHAVIIIIITVPPLEPGENPSRPLLANALIRLGANVDMTVGLRPSECVCGGQSGGKRRLVIRSPLICSGGGGRGRLCQARTLGQVSRRARAPCGEGWGVGLFIVAL